MTDIMLPFRKKPVVIDAVQINAIEDACRAPGVCTGGITCKSKGAPDDACPHVHTLEGDHSWTPGDYLIRGVKGEYYFCKPDIFEMTYEPATAESSSSSSTAQTEQRDTSEPTPSNQGQDQSSEPVAVPRQLHERHQWAQPGDEPHRAFILRFSDPDCREHVFTGKEAERNAYEAWNRFSQNWNVYLFGTVPLEPLFAAPPQPQGVTISREDVLAQFDALITDRVDDRETLTGIQREIVNGVIVGLQEARAAIGGENG